MKSPWKRTGIRTWLILCAIAAIVTGHASPASLLAGSGLLAISLAIQFWSKGCLHRSQQVTRSGPYRFARHPFYIGNFILDTGIAVMSGFLPLILVAPLWWLAVYIPVMRREERKLIKLFGDDYRQYMQAVPRFPGLRWAEPATGAGFSWRNRDIVMQETPRALRFISYPLAFFLLWRITEGGPGIPVVPTRPELLAAAALPATLLASRIWQRHFLQGRSILPPSLRDADLRALLFGLVIAGGLLHAAFEAEDHYLLHWLPGLAFVAMAIAVRRLRLSVPMLSEASLMLALLWLFEFGFLAPAAAVYYLAVALDRNRAGTDSGAAQAHDFPGSAFASLCAVGFITALLAETVIPVG